MKKILYCTILLMCFMLSASASSFGSLSQGVQPNITTGNQMASPSLATAPTATIASINAPSIGRIGRISRSSNAGAANYNPSLSSSTSYNAAPLGGKKTVTPSMLCNATFTSAASGLRGGHTTYDSGNGSALAAALPMKAGRPDAPPTGFIPDAPLNGAEISLILLASLYLCTKILLSKRNKKALSTTLNKENY